MGQLDQRMNVLHRPTLLWVVLLAMTFGCAAHVKKVRLHADATHPVRVASVELEPGATKLTAVGSYKVGKYKRKDLRVLKKMLTQTIPVHGAKEESFRIHLVMRRVLIAHSPSVGSAMACVAWALTDPRGALIFDEQFYAAATQAFLGSISGVKNRIHKGITKRVHATAQAVASGQPPGPAPKYTYDDFESASGMVPSELSHTSHWGGRYVTFSIRRRGGTGKSFVGLHNRIDWHARLGIPKPAEPPTIIPFPPEVPARPQGPAEQSPPGYPPPTAP